MIRINKNTAKYFIDNLKAKSYPAYSNWTDSVSLNFLSGKDCIILYSDEIVINSIFKKEEFYILKNIVEQKNPIICGIVFHIPSSIFDQCKDKEDYAEIAFVKNPVLEPTGIGEVLFERQSIRLDQDNQINILEFLELDIIDKIKDIFLFHINEFSQNGVYK